jgi:hypothetical protein
LLDLPKVLQPDTRVGFAYYLPNETVQLEVPEDTKAFSALWNDSTCFLIVLADEEYK